MKTSEIYIVSVADLISTADAYKIAAGVPADSTVSSRVFGDGKKLGALRDGRCDITLGRLRRALTWFCHNWPEGAEAPPILAAAKVAFDMASE